MLLWVPASGLSPALSSKTLESAQLPELWKILDHLEEVEKMESLSMGKRVKAETVQSDVLIS